jgi:hypothetical protein
MRWFSVALTALALTLSPAYVGFSASSPLQQMYLLDPSHAWVPFGQVDPTAHKYLSPIFTTNNDWTGSQTFSGPVNFTGSVSRTLNAGASAITGSCANSNYKNAGGLGCAVTMGRGRGVIQNGAPRQRGFSSGPMAISAAWSGLAINVTTLTPTPMQASSAGHMVDNSPMLASLIAAQGPKTGYTGRGGIGAFFPAIPGQAQTEYYFSRPLDWSRSGKISCAGGAGGWPVYLEFAPGVDGIIQDHENYSPDGGGAEGSQIAGCNIISLGYTFGRMTPGSTAATAGNWTPGTIIPQPPFGVDDGIIASASYFSVPYLQSLLATAPGTYVTAVRGGNLTLSQPSTAPPSTTCGNPCSVAIYRLPAALAYRVNTTVGSSQITMVSSPTDPITSQPIPIVPGDLIWNDAFPFGATVSAVSGSTVSIVGVEVYPGPTATITHTGGSGKLWRIPAGIKRRVGTTTWQNAINNWPIGLQMPCASSFGGLGCNSSHDGENQFAGNLVGRLATGNNSGASVSYHNVYNNNHVADIIEVGSVGSLYEGDNANSWDNSYGQLAIVGWCNGFSMSVYVGMYAPQNWWNSGVPGQYFSPYCMSGTGAIDAPPVPTASKINPPTGPLSVGPSNGGWVGAPTIASNGVLWNGWSFHGDNAAWNYANAPTPAGSVAVHMTTPGYLLNGMTITDTTTPTAIPANTTVSGVNTYGFNLSKPAADLGIQTNDVLFFEMASLEAPCVTAHGGWTHGALSFGRDCSTYNSFALGFNSFWGPSWILQPTDDLNAPLMQIANVNDYSGYNTNPGGEIIYPMGFELSNQLAACCGQERLIDDGASVPTASTATISATAPFTTANTKIPVSTCSGFSTGNWTLVDSSISGSPFFGPVLSCGNVALLTLTAAAMQTSLTLTDALSFAGSAATTTASDAWTTGNTTIPVASCSGVSAGQSVADTTLSGSPTIGTVSSCASEPVLALYPYAPSPRASAGPSDSLLVTTRLQGDIRFNQVAAAGGFMGWINTAHGSNFKPAGPVANDTAGASWTLGNYMQLKPVAIASLPTCNAGEAGTFAVIDNGVASPTYNANVGTTTGRATAPVFCNGSNWTYR